MRILKPCSVQPNFYTGSTLITCSIDDLITLLEERSVTTSYKNSNNSHEVKLLEPYSQKKTNFKKHQINNL